MIRLLALLVLASPAGAQITFGDAHEVTGDFGSVTATDYADLDGDGDVDEVAAVSDTRPGNLVVRMGLGREFSEHRRLPLGEGVAVFLRIGDVDLDGDADLVSIEQPNPWTRRARVLLQGPAGEFTSAALVRAPGAAGSPIERVEIFDVDGDGATDLVLDDGFSLYATLGLLGPAPAVRTLLAQVPVDWGVLDVDGDGAVDIATRSAFAGELRVARGLGGAVFAPPVPALHGGQPIANGRFADLDGDGRVEILRADSGSDLIRHDRSAGLNFDSSITLAALDPNENQTSAPHLIDITGDGIDDVLFTRFASALFASFDLTLEGLGGGAFAAPVAVTAPPVSTRTALRYEDVDGDGRADAVLDDLGADFNEWTPGGLAFDGAGLALSVTARSTRALTAFDVDRDGDLDLVTGGLGGTQQRGLLFAENTGAGTFGPIQVLDDDAGIVESLVAGDFDGDGDDDLLAARSDGSILLLLWDGPLSFATETTPGFVGNQVRGAQVVDRDGDGLNEVLGRFRRFGGSPAPDALGVLFRDAPGTDVRFFPGFISLVYLDVDEDGLTDLVNVNGFVTQWSRRLPNGNLVFQGDLLPIVAEEMRSRDVDGDGLRDLVYLFGRAVWWARRTAPTGNSFAAPVRLIDPSLNRITAYDLIDIDGDGHLDALLTEETNKPPTQLDFVTRPGLGGGAFGPALSIASNFAAPPTDVPVSFDSHLADLDLDGDLDLLVWRVGVTQAFGYVALCQNVERVGVTSCGPSAVNSSGTPSRITATGTLSTTSQDLRLRATGLPRGEFGIFATSRSAGAPVAIGGSTGSLCLTGLVGRFNGPGQVLSTGDTGTMVLDVDPSAFPLPVGTTAAMAGETWHFQGWFRDSAAGQPGNLTDAVSLGF